MSPQKRIAQSTVLTWALILFNAGWAFYLLRQPLESFQQSIIWRGALGATPFHSPRVLGAAVALVAVWLLFAYCLDMFITFGLALILGMGTWGLLAYSFAFSAWTSNPKGLGMGGTISALLALFLHGFVLAYRK